MPLKTLQKIKEFDAHGGPVKSVLGADGHSQDPTRTGRYVIGIVDKHVSYGKYVAWSGIAWGSEMKKTGDVVMVKHRGVWTKLTDVNAAWAKFKNDQKAVVRYIQNYYASLGMGNGFPTHWIFNDFGHVSVKYFKDLNHDRRLNGKESIMGDFIHTTPVDEVRTARKIPFQLGESHGCIHVRPLQIDEMISNGYLKKGNIVEVHAYTQQKIDTLIKRDTDGAAFEVHFYPLVHKIAVYRPLS